MVPRIMQYLWCFYDSPASVNSTLVEIICVYVFYCNFVHVNLILIKKFNGAEFQLT